MIAESQLRWDRYFLSVAMLSAVMSKDPATKVGCVIVGADRVVRATGFNGFPRGVADTPERLNDRTQKLKYVVHAERNAICSAARNGVSLLDTTAYIAATDDTGELWGGHACSQCTIELIQAGIRHIISYPRKGISKWTEDLELGKAIAAEAGLTFREVIPASQI